MQNELVEEIDKVMLLIQSLEIRSKYDNVKILTTALESLEYVKNKLSEDGE